MDRFVHTTLKTNSVFNPQNSLNHHIEVFKPLVEAEIREMKFQHIRDKDYISCGIKSLESKKDIIIRPADKGGGEGLNIGR